MKSTSMIYLFCGLTKGKTSSALGTVVRALGHEKKVRIVFFMKNWKTCEVDFLEKLPKPAFDVEFYKSGDNNFVFVDKDTNHITLLGAQKQLKFGKITEKDLKDIEQAQQGYAKALSYLQEKPFLLVLDEILVCAEFGLLTWEQIENIMDLAKAEGVHLVVTGRQTTENITKKADLVTIMTKVKHPFDKDIFAVKGLDY